MDYREKKEEMMEKYKYAIYAISVANGMDIGVAFDMLISNMTRGGNYPYVKAEEFNKDYDELLNIAKGQVGAK